MKRILTFCLLLFSTIHFAGQDEFYQALADSALTLTRQHVTYDPRYYSISYPSGDIPPDKGVCTDVLIRAYRKMGIDLQKEVHEDMEAHFDVYPDKWGLKAPDKNIDHRRVLNLMTFFSRNGETLPVSQNPLQYQPGDIVCWNLGNNILHIGLVAGDKSSDGKRYLIIHNIGSGQVLADCLFDYEIISHFRYWK